MCIRDRCAGAYHALRAAVKAIGDRCRVYTIDGADHIFSQSEPRALLVKLLGSELTE